MTRDHVPKLRYFEGRRVSLALADGSRVDDCELVSAGRRGAETLWVFTNGRDAFLPLEDVIDLWEAPALSDNRATWGWVSSSAWTSGGRARWPLRSRAQPCTPAARPKGRRNAPRRALP